MANHVLRMVCEGWSASFMRAATPRGLHDKRNSVVVWVTVKLDILGSRGHVTGPGTGC